MELLVPATSKNDWHGNRVEVQNEKLKKMMRNHHFTFGTDRASFWSTNEANFITHNIKSNCNIKKYLGEPNNISSLTRSKSFSSVPLNVVNQTGVLKIKSVVDPNVTKIKNLSAFTHSSQKWIKDHRNIIFNPKKTLKDDYQSMTSTTLATINNNEKSNFIKRLSQQNAKDQFDSLSK